MRRGHCGFSSVVFPGKEMLLLMGVLADKDFHGIFDAILPLAARIAAVTPDSHRALPAPELCQRLRDEYGYAAAVPYATMTDALRSCSAAPKARM